MDRSEKITVLLPLYNGQRFLRKAIDSILAQTYSHFQLLIIDDGSTDESVSIVKSYSDPRIHLLHNESNIGLAATLNRGLQEAKTVWVARHDQDDISFKDRFARQLAYLKKHPDTVLLGGQGTMIDEGGRFQRPLYVPSDRLAVQFRACFGNPFLHGSVVMNREVVLNEFGGYKKNGSDCEDFELWTRMLQKNKKITNLKNRLIYYRQHPNSMRAAVVGKTNFDFKECLKANLFSLLGESDEIYEVSNRIWAFILKTQYIEGGAVSLRDVLAIRKAILLFNSKYNLSKSIPLRKEKARLHLVSMLHSSGLGVTFRYAVRGFFRSIFLGK